MNVENITGLIKPDLITSNGTVDDIKFALEKQIPKKPIDKTKPDDSASRAYENCHIVVCPTCGGRLKLKSKGKYCDKCGQALDWEAKYGKK